MFEVLVLLYLLVHICFILYSYRGMKGQNELSFIEVVGRQLSLMFTAKLKKSMLLKDEEEKLKRLHSQKTFEGAKQKYIGAKLGLIYIVLAIGGLFSIILGEDYTEAEPLEAIISRPNYGEAPLNLQVDYKLDDTEGHLTLPITVEPRLPSKEEALDLLEGHHMKIFYSILGDLNSEDRVIRDLSFIESPFDIPIKVVYKSLTPIYLTDSGQLRRNQMEVGTPYNLAVQAQVFLGESKLTYVYEMIAYKQAKSIEAEELDLANRIIVDDTSVQLPTDLDERLGRVTWFTSEQGIQWYRIILFTLLIAVLLFVLKQRELDLSLRQRKDEILYDFPDIVSKLTMLLNAGMTFSRAWQKVVLDYQESSNKSRPLYDEMVIASSQMLNGMPEVEALEAFGRRTRNLEVIRMTGVLIQNLRRGNNALTEALKQLSKEAWEIRVMSAKKQGEEASTKLLLPMAISFVTVIMIVIAPTLMSINI